MKVRSAGSSIFRSPKASICCCHAARRERARLSTPTKPIVLPEIVVEQARGRVPVIIGAGSNSTAKAIQATKTAKKLGADGVLSVGPLLQQADAASFYEHFKAIAEAEDISSSHRVQRSGQNRQQHRSENDDSSGRDSHHRCC